MRGDDPQHGAMFSYISPEERVPQEYPWRSIGPSRRSCRRPIPKPPTRTPTTRKMNRREGLMNSSQGLSVPAIRGKRGGYPIGVVVHFNPIVLWDA